MIRHSAPDSSSWRPLNQSAECPIWSTRSMSASSASSAELADEALMDLVDQIGHSADWFKGLQELLSGAECRIMCAYAARAVQSDVGS